jgi:phage I-like protein
LLDLRHGWSEARLGLARHVTSRYARHVRYVTLSIELPSEPPSEFLIFRAGVNPTDKGDFVFDAAAAQAVMAEYAREGHDCMLDLEHDSINPAVRLARSDARDAMAYYGLELRAGALWAVNVKWTAEGIRRLAARTQRFVSPAFADDKDTGRVLRFVNCGLVSMPAMYDAPALVAASTGKTAETKEALRLALRAVCALPHSKLRRK